jgi:hypothetical protein
MDYEGNGIYTDVNDRLYLMSQDDPTDLTTTDGKKYSININGLPTGTNWTARIIASDGIGCNTNFGPFNAPDVYELPNLVIFANDINFSPVHPNPGDNLVVSATVHNASDFDAQNFYVHLTNQYDSINFTYPNILISNLPARTSTTVNWTLVAPPVAAWVPMEVRIDETNVISETNELDNRAIRPFVNGNFNLPGGIVCNAQVSPFASNSAASNFPVISGNVHYYGLAVPLADSSVAGATVTFTIIETGSVFTGYTGSNGYYSIPLQGPIDTGLYHVNVSITDYTLTGNCSTTFRILPALLLPDLVPSISIGYTNGVAGTSLSGTITVTNSGTANAPASLLGVWQSGGAPVVANQNVGALAIGQSQTFPFGPIITSNPGTFSICATADALFAIPEKSETNNYKCESIQSYGSGGGGGGGGGGFGNLGSLGFNGGGGFACQASSFSILLRNSGTAAVGSFVVEVLISKNGVLQTTLTQTVTGIAALTSIYVTFPYNYASVGPGNYTYEVNCDIYNSIVESDKGDNTSFYSSTLLPCKPNLLFANCDSISTSPANAIPGGTINLIANVHNNGNAPAIGSVAVRFNYSNGAQYTATYNGNIAQYATVPISVSAPVPPIGTTVYAIIDPLNTISEESEGDNVSPTWNLGYDFKIDTLCGTGTNMWEENYNLFEVLNLRAGISNAGLLTATNVKVRFQISGPGITGTLNLGTAIVPVMGRTCKCPVQAYLPNGYVFTLNGLYTVTVTADPLGEFAEYNESNNVKVIYIQVSDLPEYRILSQYINPSLLNPDVGQPISVDVTYENVGRENVNDSMRLNFLADNILQQSVYPVSGLPKNGHATVAIPGTWSSNIPGIHILRAVIDADSTVDESNELNNEGTRAIVVGQSANLYFQLFQPSILNPSLYQTISLNTRIGNSGDLPCEADVQYYRITGTDTLPISNLFHINVPANDSVVLAPFSWLVIQNSTKLVAKIINSLSLEYTYDDNITVIQIGAFNLTINTVNESCPNAANGTATASVSGGNAPYSFLWSNSSGSVGSGALLTTSAGNYTVTVTDNTGQSVSAVCTIGITPDVTNPVILNCPANISQCNTQVNWTPPTATDNCSTPTLSSNHQPGETFPLGNTQVIYTADDGNGNTASFSFTVTITAPPVWYLDADADGYFTGTSITACTSPGAGYTTIVLGGGDCNDTLATVFPGAPEICGDGIDNNCDGQIDEGCCTASTTPSLILSDDSDNEICSGNTVNLTVTGGSLGDGASWKWYKTSCGSSLVGNGASIAVSPTTTTTYFVRAEGTCGITACIPITIVVRTLKPVVNVSVPFNGMPVNICNGTVAAISCTAVPTASFYTWDVAGTGTYFDGNPLNVSPYVTTSPSVTINFGNSNGSMYQIGAQAGNACGSSLRQIQQLRGQVSVPASISGSLTACANTSGTYSTASVSGASQYIWSITGDATVSGSGTTVVVNFGSAWTGGSLCVAAQTSCFTSLSKCITITRSSTPLSNLTGNGIACPNSTGLYGVTAAAGTASYQWTLPPGASGVSTTNSINVNFGSAYGTAGSICVTTTSICGLTSAPLCKTVTPGLPSVPTSITGFGNGVCNQSVVYSTPAQTGVTYNWTAPGTITSNSSNAITVQYGLLSTGQVCVAATNTCGTSAQRCITVKGAPNTPLSIAAIPSTWCANTSGIEFDVNTSGINGSYNLSWSYPTPPTAIYQLGGGNSTFLLLDWGIGNGNVSVTVSNSCGSGTKVYNAIVSCREDDSTTDESLISYPNPASNFIKLKFNASAGTASFSLKDLTGREVLHQSINTIAGANSHQIDVHACARGAYILTLSSSNGRKQIKIVLE